MKSSIFERQSLYARRWARVAKAHRVRMLAIEATLATRERAKVLGLDHEVWRDVMFQGCLVDHRAIAMKAKKLTGFMSGKGTFEITSSAGTRLAFDLHRRPVNLSDGISTNEMVEDGRVVFLPAGSIEVSVDEESAAGRIVYSAPVRLGSDMVENLIFELKDGLIMRYSATSGLKALDQYMKTGGKDATRLSYFGFGLNPNLRRGFTQDDKVLGGLTLGFGGNKSMGGKNAVENQWWASVTGATVRFDDRTLMAEGKLVAW